MNTVVEFLLYALPWWVQIGILVTLAAGALLIAANIFGWNAVRGWIVPIVGVLAALGLASRSRQQGYNDRRAHEEKALDKAEEIHDDVEERIQKMPDHELNDEVDRWSRK